MDMITQNNGSSPELPARTWFRSRSGNWCSKAADGGLLVIFEHRGRYKLMHKMGDPDAPFPTTFGRVRFASIADAKDEADAFERRTLAAIRRRA